MVIVFLGLPNGVGLELFMSRPEPKVQARYVTTVAHPTLLILPMCARPQQNSKPLTNPS